MPKYWHDRHAANRIEDESEREFCRSIVADKKPYFMKYIYPQLMKQYNTYIKNTNRNALREFQMSIEELTAADPESLSERQKEFLKYFNSRMPVGVAPCVMNRICKRFEEEFDGYIGKHHSKVAFDYTIMKYGEEYTASQFRDIKRLYDEYMSRVRNYMMFSEYERVDECESSSALLSMKDEFEKKCFSLCQNKFMLCDILLDICYTRNSSKKFAWSICGKDIINSLLKHNSNTISFPKLDDDGDVVYCGERYSIVEKVIEVVD